MGRNTIPKLDEWRDGAMHRFRAGNSLVAPEPEDGRQIVYERLTPGLNASGLPVPEVLATCYADGFMECLASMFRSGYDRGRREGAEAARAEIRAAMGISGK